MSNPTPVQGTTLKDYIDGLEKRPLWADFKLSDAKFQVGDLVTYASMSWSNGMTIYRIDKDFPLRLDAVWGPSGRYRATRYYSGQKMAWVKPGTRTAIPKIRVRGCVEIVPVCQLFPGPPTGRRTVSYEHLFRLRKIDVLQLGKSFSQFQDFIQAEIKRIQGV